MNLTVPKKDLLRITTRALGIADRKSTMPVLGMVLLDAKGAALTITATDLYRSLVDRTTANVDASGSVAIAAKDLVDRVKTLPDGPVSIVASERSIVLKSKVSARKFTLPMLPGGDYPPIPAPSQDAPRMTLPADVLERLIGLTAYSISFDTSRAHLNCALLEWSGQTVRMVSTDGHRLSKAEVTVEGQAASSMLIPQNGIQMIEAIASDARGASDEAVGELQIIPSGSTAFFLAGSAMFGVKLTDANFPPYEQVIPKAMGDQLRANRSALLDAVRAVSLAAAERNGAVRMSVTKGKLLLTSEDPKAGDGSDELGVEYTGKNFVTGANARYLIETLGALSSEDVAIDLLGELEPIILRPVDPAGVDFLGVIMPVRI